MKIIAGLFDSLDNAERAKAALAQSGVAHGQPCVSRNLAEDDMAAEGAVCVVSVKVDSKHGAAVAAALMRHHGARGGILRVPRSKET